MFLQENRRLQPRFIFLALAAVFTLGALYQPLVRAPAQSALEARGVETTAQIIELFTVSCRVFTKRCSSKNKRARIAFQTNGGETIQFVKRVSRDFYTMRKVGDQIDLIYMPEDPSTYRLDMGYRMGLQNTFILFAFLTVVTSFLTYAYWYPGE